MAELAIQVLVVATLAGGAGFLAGWWLRAGAAKRQQQAFEEELAVWRETCDDIRQETESARERATALARKLRANRGDKMRRIVELETELAAAKQSKADVLAAVLNDVKGAKKRYEARIADLEAALAKSRHDRAEEARTRQPRPDAEGAVRPAAEAPAAEAPAVSERPRALNAPLGAADDLKQIRGVGPKLEQTLNDLGIFHYRQLAGLSEKNVSWIDSYLRFKGRIERDDWIGQAERLSRRPSEQPSRKEPPAEDRRAGNGQHT